MADTCTCKYNVHVHATVQCTSRPHVHDAPTFVSFDCGRLHRVLPSGKHAAAYPLQELCDHRDVVPVHNAVERLALPNPPPQVVVGDKLQGVVQLLKAEAAALLLLGSSLQ